MELLIAFLLAFGVISSSEVNSLKSADEAQELITKSNLDKEYIIWDAEADDF
ncbi:MAG: hypothetical protein H6603_07180 [Flavobacteriales bacterium]|jgi:archaellum component FlaF (FlaF/FlaG flagellin family)|nr:hypothetical protein [Flavobacteriales bacterium]MCB9191833.1 hypothetical protein [Flavobacteriales bacterium]MCB9204746.1 hypothetical protein [Flavobacteriales bacterium]